MVKLADDAGIVKRIDSPRSDQKPNGTRALEFLQLLYPEGPWILTAIVPDGAIVTRTFSSPRVAAAREFIVEHNDNGENIYYSVNPTKRALQSKATKKDIAAAVYLHVDIDPDDDESLRECKARALKRVDRFPHPPTFIIDSGNGLQLLWQLAPLVELADERNIAKVEARNHALAEVFKADPSTRNVDRILRLPGTINYPNAKKRKLGRVECRAKLLGFEDVTYPARTFRPRAEAEPPPAPNPLGRKVDLPPNLRSMLYHTTKAGYRTRSELLFAFLCTAVRNRAITDDMIVAAVLDPDPGGVIYQHCREQQKDDAAYVRNQIHRARRKVGVGDLDTRPLTLRRVDRFARRELRWLWWPFIPRGMLTMIFGDGEVGKSTLALDIAARITKGDHWPRFGEQDRDQRAPLGSVIVVSKEDDAAMIIRPRLEAVGADLTRMHVLGYQKPEEDGEFDPADRLDTRSEELERLITQRGDVRLVIIDPITDFLGHTDMYKDDQVRALLHPLARIAARHDLAIIFILHLNKNSEQAARYRGLGSIGFRNVVKSSLLVAKNPEQHNSRFLAQEKKNLTPEQRTVTFLLRPVARSAFSGLQWGEQWPGHIEVDELLNTKSSKQQQATQLLRHCLKDGPRPANEVRAWAERRAIKPATLKLAKKTMGIISEPDDGVWFWQLPKPAGAER